MLGSMTDGDGLVSSERCGRWLARHGSRLVSALYCPRASRSWARLYTLSPLRMCQFPPSHPSSKPRPKNVGASTLIDKHWDNGTTPGAPRSAETLVTTKLSLSFPLSDKKHEHAETYSPDPPRHRRSVAVGGACELGSVRAHCGPTWFWAAEEARLSDGLFLA